MEGRLKGVRLLPRKERKSEKKMKEILRNIEERARMIKCTLN